MPSPEDILSIDRAQVPQFIRELVSEKTLSTLMQQLNELLIAGDEASRELAARALQHLGFPETA